MTWGRRKEECARRIQNENQHITYSLLELYIHIRILINCTFSLLQTGHSALQRAAAEGHLEVVKHLVGRGAAVDHQDEVVSNRRL